MKWLFWSVWFFAGCTSKPPSEPADWWTAMMLPGKTVIQAVGLPSRQSNKITISGSGSRRLGVLVRQSEEMCKSLDDANDSSGGVYLIQVTSGLHIGTCYSASNLFDLSLGNDFLVENRSSIGSDVVVYSEVKVASGTP